MIHNRGREKQNKERNNDEKYSQELIEGMRGIAQDKALFEGFLEDLFTPKERKEIAKRWQIVKLLDRDIPHREIAKQLHVAIATVSRGAREMQDLDGGFRQALWGLRNAKKRKNTHSTQTGMRLRFFKSFDD